MDKTAIKNYAIWARTKLIEDIKYKASLLGITEKGIADALAQSTTQEQYFDIGTREPYAIRGVQIAQRRSLAEAIKKKAQESDYLTAYNSIIEEVAYTWFNRFIAVRFMEVNDYLPCKIRVLSAVDGRQEPDIVQNPFDAKLNYTSAEEELISQHQMNNEGDKLFNMLFVKVCNDLSKVLPQLFEAEQDYTELLLNISYTDQDGLIYKLVHDIPEDNFDVNAVDEEGKPVGQVEIIGWLYQYYNTEPKNETFALLKKNVKITKERIPSATQLFTPDWIVRYMVENSLGRLWYEGHSESTLLKENWKYYLDEAQQEEAVQAELMKLKEEYAKLRPEDIKVIDPCMGSGHILVYAFDVLMQIYTQMGYTDKDAVLSILENNLYGLDIDKRAFQLAYFAVLMKARQYHKFILKKQPQCHIYAIAESNGINMKYLAYFGAQLDELAKPVALNQMQELIATLHDAKEYGSIISVADYDWNLLHQFAAEFDISGEMNLFDSFGIEATQQRLHELIAVGEVLAQKYEVVVTNPPYMGSSGMGAKLSAYVKQNYPDSKSDLFAVFITKAGDFVKDNGIYAMITQPSVLFLSSFEKLRISIIENSTILNLLHMGRGIFGIDFGSTAFVLRKNKLKCFCGNYFRLHERTFQYIDPEDISRLFLISKDNHDFKYKFSSYDTSNNVTVYSRCNDGIKIYFEIKQENFAKIPGAPVAYWVSENVINAFTKEKLQDYANVTNGLFTCNNNLFLRLWSEISYNKFFGDCHDKITCLNSEKKWYPYNKGGNFRKWYGNHEYVVNFSRFGEEISNYRVRNGQSASFPGQNFYFNSSLSWSLVTSGSFAIRYYPKGFVFDIAGSSVFSNNNSNEMTLLGFLGSCVARNFLCILNPTLNYQAGNIRSLPIINDIFNHEEIEIIVKDNIVNSIKDWDAFENSWDFTKHPLLRNKSSISEAYSEWEAECNARFAQLKANEEELNRIFIDIYGLQDELTPEVEDKDVTVRKADLQRDIKSLLSYAVGCMFGRYSLDVEGLAYAGGTWDDSKYVTFKPDEDNVIPITDEDYFEDDIIGRLIAWLKVVYGAETLEENLRFIADALGTSGDTARQKIRNYFLKDFFKDHCKIYQKRPIYWLYDSGKQNGFKALIYMHRYNADTSGQVRAEYLGKMEETYESEINRMQDIMDNGAGREVALAGKRKEKLQKQLHECREYDAVLGHIALASIDIDLDDGVKVNYVKVQTAKDGKLLPILAKI